MLASMASSEIDSVSLPEENEVDVDEIEGDEELTQTDSNYQELVDAIDRTDNTETDDEFEKIKNTVHQQIFVNSNMLTELGRMFNCEIIFKRKNGSYAIFIRPNETDINYMINITNGTNAKYNKERIFFNLSLKQEGKTKIKTEYISEYLVENGFIYHEFRMEGKPYVLKKNRVDLNIREKIFNPYLKLNELIEKYLGYGERINMESSIDLLNEKITKLRKRLNTLIPKDLETITEKFKNEQSKEELDEALNRDYLFLKQFIPFQLGNKRPEEIEFRIPNKVLYKTNNKFIDILALRYATFISDFEFTKSCNRIYTYTDPLSFKLTTPFTATDIYLHKFDRHFNEEYAMDRYNLDTPDKLHRLAELVELSKSIMMNFVSISYEIMSSQFLYNKKEFRTIDIHNIYPALVWNRGTSPVFSKKFEIQKRKFDGKFIGINIKLLDDRSDVPTKPINLIQANEIPYIGATLPVNRTDGCDRPYKKIQVVSDADIKQLDAIDLQGVERFMFGSELISSDILDKMFLEFFNSTREVATKTDAKPAEYIELTPEEFREAFPELVNLNTVPGIVSVIDKSGSSTLQQPRFTPKYTSQPVISKPNTTTGTPVTISPTETKAPAVTKTPAVTKPSMATILRTQIPYSQDISKIIIDIRQFKKNNSKPIPGETRKQRAIRLKQIRPMIEKLEGLRRRQLEALNETGQSVPQDFGRQTTKLYEEGLITLSRKQQLYQDLVKSVKEKTAELNTQAETIREYRINAKSETQKTIVRLMEEINDKNRLLHITIPNDIISKASATASISKSMYDELYEKQTPIMAEIKILETDLKQLQELDIKEQQTIDANRTTLEASAIEREEKDTDIKAKEKLKMIEKDKKMIQETREEYDALRERERKLKKIINDGLITSKPDSPLNKYYNHALQIIRRALKSYAEYGTAVEYLAVARAKPENEKPSEKEMQMYVNSYKESLKKSRDDIQLFNEIEEIFYNTPDEIERIAIKLYGISETTPSSGTISSQKKAEDKRAQIERLTELEIKKAELEQSEATLLQGLTETEAEDKRKLLKETALKNEEIFQSFIKRYTKKTEIIEHLKGETQYIVSKLASLEEKTINKALDVKRVRELLSLQKQTKDQLQIEVSEHTRRTLKGQLADINYELYNPKLTPAQKKAVLKELDDLKETLLLLNSVLEFKTLEQNILLLENEELIKTNSKIKDEQKAKILAQIEEFKSSGTVDTLQTKKQLFDTNLLENQEFIRNNTHLRDKIKTYLIKNIDKLIGSEVSDATMDKTKTQEKRVAEDERKKYMEWERENNKLFEEIKKMETDLKGSNPMAVEGGIMRRLKDVNIQLLNTSISKAKADKFKEEKDDLENRIRIISKAIDKKTESYNKFLLANESLIKNNANFKDTKLKTQLIERIERYKTLLYKQPGEEINEERVSFDQFDPFGSKRPATTASSEGETFSIY